MKWICLIALCSSGAWSQAASNGTDAAATGILNDIHAVNSLEKSLAFYREVFELNCEAQVFPNAGIPALVNSPGARLRIAVLQLPNTSFGLELAEFSGVERKPVRLNVSDPGAGTLVLRVRDLDRVVDAAKKSGAEIVTPSGAPVKLRPTAIGSRAILMRDPDGYLVEGEKVSPSDGSPSHGNVQTAGMRFAMADRSATLKFYGDLLGLKLNGGTEFRLNPTMNAFAGTPDGVEVRALNVNAPGTNPLVFYEFKDAPHTQFHHRVPEPGLPAISFRVKDLEGSLNPVAAHVFDKGEPHPVVKRRTQLLGHGRFDIVKMHSIQAAAAVVALDGRGAKDGRRAGQLLADSPDRQVGFFAHLHGRHPVVGDEHYHAECENAPWLSFQAPALGHGRHERILAKKPSPDFRKVGENGRRIREMAPQQFKASGKVVFFERADEEIHSPRPRAEYSAFGTLSARAAAARRIGPGGFG